MATVAAPTKVVGQRMKRVDGVERVTGKAVYGADLTLPGTLYGKVLRSPHPHARIRSIDYSRALKLPGVKAIVTSADFPPVQLGSAFLGGEVFLSSRDARRMQMAEDKAFYQGHAIAAVAATDAHVAEEALKLIEVDYEVLPPVLDVESAIQADAPLVQEDLRTWEFGGAKSDRPSNIVQHVELGRGDVGKGFAEADIVLERTFRGGTVHQGYIEPQACTAAVDSSGHVTVYATNQANFNLRDTLCTVLGLPQNRVTVVPLEIGGGFGGKGNMTIELPAVLLALKSGRPVKIAMSREEVFRATGPTCAHVIDLKVGAKKDGTLTAFQARYVLDGGAAAGFGHASYAAYCGSSHYRIPNIHADCYDVVTNKAVHDAYRAPSGPIGNFPTEAILDELAEQLGMDPIDLRLKNVAHEGDTTTRGLPMPVWGLPKILEMAKKHPAWTSPIPKGRGRGFAAAYWSAGGETSSAEIVGHADATFSVTIGSVDLTGVRTTMAQITAEELGISPDRVHVRHGDTDSVGYTGGSWGSRVTMVTGAAVQAAARDVLRKLTEHAALEMGVTPEDIEYRDQVFRVKDDASKHLSLAQVCAKSTGSEGGSIQAVGMNTGMPAAPQAAASIAEVEVDKETGRTRVVKWTIFQDPGKAINPLAVEGQMQGGAVQGIGWALWEVYNWENGSIRNASLLDYRMPTALDLPMIEPVIVETPNPLAPYGARGVGEVPIITPVAAMANAIHSATGVRLYQTPFNPERVFWALHGKGDGR